MTALRLDRVSFWYPATDRAALSDVTLEVGAGEVVALVGNVGAGASTLLLVAAGLAPRVTGGRLEGTVELPQSALLLPTPWTQVSGMAFTVWDEVAFGPANLGWPIERIRQSVDRAVAALAIDALESRDPATLSGGELQRVILAGLIAMESPLLLLDEPMAELDPAGVDLLVGVVRELAGAGKTIVVATSDLDAVPELADRVVWLDQGTVRRAGRPHEVLGDDAVWERGPGGTAVAGVWRAAGLAAPHPLTLAGVRERLR